MRTVPSGVGLGEGVDDAVFAGRTDVVDCSGQGWRGPQQSAERIGEDPDVHAVLLVLAGVEGSVRELGAVVDVACGEGECRRRAAAVDDQVDLGAQPVPGPAEGSAHRTDALFLHGAPAAC